MVTRDGAEKKNSKKKNHCRDCLVNGMQQELEKAAAETSTKWVVKQTRIYEAGAEAGRRLLDEADAAAAVDSSSSSSHTTSVSYSASSAAAGSSYSSRTTSSSYSASTASSMKTTTTSSHYHHRGTN